MENFLFYLFEEVTPMLLIASFVGGFAFVAAAIFGV
jgi:hypothetical protein